VVTKVGFTGTQAGMTPAQARRLTDFLKADMEFHHGDCIGADAQGRNLAYALGARIIAHPPTDPKKQAGTGYHEAWGPRDYIQRNHDIVDAADYLIACPQHMVEELRSGTWATIRYARKVGKNVIIIYPDGSDSNG